MTCGHYLYAIAGVLLTFWLLMEDETPFVNALLMALLIGPFVGVPLFLIVLVCFGNWPVIVRTLWGFFTFPIAWHMERRLKTREATTVNPASQGQSQMNKDSQHD